MKLFHLRHTWSLTTSDAGRTRRTCLHCGKSTTLPKTRASERRAGTALMPYQDEVTRFTQGGGFGAGGG